MQILRLSAFLVVSMVVMTISAAIAQSSNPPPAISATTRLITVDVVASDPHGDTVSDLKAADFQIFDDRSGPQKIARFEYIDRFTTPASPPVGPPSPETAATYSNQSYTRLAVPPTILLIDALNVAFSNHLEAHQQALMLLRQLPADTPAAVFLLTHNLSIVQNFTTDPTSLTKAVNRAFGANLPKIINPENDPNSPDNKVDGPMKEALEKSEKRDYAEQLTVIADQSADAMIAIARYLSGYPGRKNLVWLSEAFPLWIKPGADFGGRIDAALASNTRETFSASASFVPQVRSAAQALADARVSIYPADARGLEVSGLYTATQDPPAMTSSSPTRASAGGPMAAQLTREDAERLDAQNTMEEMAEDTGGVACKNTNDLSGCVSTALKNSSSHYEISYYPDNVRWDGSFHNVTVKTTAHGVKLRFRRGYFATDTAGLAKQQPMELLKQACASALPVPLIPLTAQTLPPSKNAGESGESRYLLTISSSGLSLTPASGSNAIILQAGICEYDPKRETFRIYERDISQTISEGADHSLQAKDIRNVIVFVPKPDTQRLRIAVLDPATGLTGSLDVPAHPRDFGNSSGTALLFTHLSFQSTSGRSSSLDSKGSSLSYRGDLGVDRAAPAFFRSTYDKEFHCQLGSLLPNDVGSAAPQLRFVFRNPSGLMAVIDLTGDQPAYSGALPVDSGAKDFFDRLWKLCHCQQP
jgi:VWFA-related protein